MMDLTLSQPDSAPPPAGTPKVIFCTRDATDEEATIECTLRPQGQEHSAAYLTKGGAALARSSR